MAKAKRKKPPSKRATCREHSCARPRGTAEGFCQVHRNPAERHHDRNRKVRVRVG